jgi:hypothetical protein
MSTQKARILATGLTGLVMMIVLVFGGAAFAANASQTAQEDDALFPLKVKIQQLQSGLTTSSPAPVESSAQAEEEAKEVTGIVQEVTDLEIVVDGVRYQLAPNAEIKNTIKVGDTVKLHLQSASDGSLSVTEVEVVGEEEDNSNENQNDNSNSNDNLSDDDDDNDNDNEDNSNDNDGEDNSNDNEDENDDNDNGDDNSNDNGSNDDGGSSDDDSDSEDDDDGDDEDDNESSWVLPSGLLISSVAAIWKMQL